MDILSFFAGNPDKQPQQNSPDKPFINHEECSDDRPSVSERIPDITQDESLWDSFDSEQNNEDREKQQTPMPEQAVLPPTYNGPKEEKQTQDPKPAPTEGGNSGKIDELKAMMDSLFERVEYFQTTIEKQQEIIKSQKRSIEKYQEDVLAKMKQPILLDLIEVLDAMELALNDNQKAPNYDALLDSMNGIHRLMIATLENYRVEPVKDAIQDPLKVSRRQQVIESKTSDDPMLFEVGGQQVNTIYVSDRPGYILNDETPDGESRQILLRPEDIIRVNYKPRQF